MPRKATEVDRGVRRNAGKESSIPSAGSAPRGQRDTTKPIAYDKMHGGAGRNERHASHMADKGSEFMRQPASGTTKKFV